MKMIKSEETKLTGSVNEIMNGIEKIVLDTYEKAEKYSEGTKHNADMFFNRHKYKVTLYIKNGKKIFVDMRADVAYAYDEKDFKIGRFDDLENIDFHISKYFIENSPKMNNYPTRHITSMESAEKYTMGTKVPAKRLFDMYMEGEQIEVIINPENITGPNGRHKKIFVFNKSGDVYNELDYYMGNYKKEGPNKFLNYLELKNN